MHIMSTNFAKMLVGNMNMTSHCDATNSAHQIQMTNICYWMKTYPMKMFCVRHWFAMLHSALLSPCLFLLVVDFLQGCETDETTWLVEHTLSLPFPDPCGYELINDRNRFNPAIIKLRESPGKLRVPNFSYLSFSHSPKASQMWLINPNLKVY